MIGVIVGLMLCNLFFILFGLNQWRINNNFIDAMEHMQNQINILAESSFREKK